jgi:hypothetical protein
MIVGGTPSRTPPPAMMVVIIIPGVDMEIHIDIRIVVIVVIGARVGGDAACRIVDGIGTTSQTEAECDHCRARKKPEELPSAHGLYS